jgi:antitoxin (DNA-binding transcriptional repressor) of toxin-antitoxin stability system
MKFIALREMRNHPQSVLTQLKKEKEIILTSHGKPVALVSNLAEETFDEDLSRHRGNHPKTSYSKAAETALPYVTDDPEILKAWVDEAEKRYDEYLMGKVKAVPALEVLKEMRKKYKK